MNSKRRPVSIVPATAVAAVTLAALAAAWTAAPAPRADRPSLQQPPVQVVKAPPLSVAMEASPSRSGEWHQRPAQLAADQRR